MPAGWESAFHTFLYKIYLKTYVEKLLEVSRYTQGLYHTLLSSLQWQATYDLECILPHDYVLQLFLLQKDCESTKLEKK